MIPHIDLKIKIYFKFLNKCKKIVFVLVNRKEMLYTINNAFLCNKIVYFGIICISEVKI